MIMRCGFANSVYHSSRIKYFLYMSAPAKVVPQLEEQVILVHASKLGSRKNYKAIALFAPKSHFAASPIDCNSQAPQHQYFFAAYPQFSIISAQRILSYFALILRPSTCPYFVYKKEESLCDSSFLFMGADGLEPPTFSV